jgi:Ohr subfamily peroxiredoxin
MAKVLYTAVAGVDGGRADGHGVTDDGVLDVQLRTPSQLGGTETGTNPEQLFAVGYAACFEGALGVAARRMRAELGRVHIDSKVSLVTDTETNVYTVAVELDVTLPEVEDGDLAKQIVAAAHETCPYSNATRGNIDVTLTANGQPVA